MKRVAVIAAGADETAVGVQHALTRLGARVVFVDTSAFPETASLSLEDGAVTFEGEDLTSIRSVYVKSVALSVPLFDVESLKQRRLPSWPRRWAAERERHALMTSAFRVLEARGAHVVNPVSKFELHLMKPLQREMLASAGVRVPASLTTNDPQAVIRFADQHGGVIYKPLAGGALVRALGPEDVKRLKSLRTAPVFFQQRIIGDEWRVTVLDGAVVGAYSIAIRGTVDVREVLHRAKKKTPPKDVAKISIAAAKALGLTFTSVDVRVDSQGRPWVLECNPTPSVSFYEAPERSPIIRSLATHLLDHA